VLQDANDLAIDYRHILTGACVLGMVLTAVGYGEAQLRALAATIQGSPADVVVSARPIDPGKLIRCDKPIIRARCEYAVADGDGLAPFIDAFPARFATMETLGGRPPRFNS
jgi:predicted GTPase